jgi:hypothetical protein
MSSKRPIRLLVALLAAFVLLVAACGDDSESSSDTTEGADTETTEEASGGLEGDLMGLFEITAGACDDAGTVTGSYFRMIEAGGTVEAGPFIPNADSTCADTEYSPLTPGAAGGLMSGDYQPAPDPAFDEAGNALASDIAEPVTFFGLAFGAATDETDVQSGDAVPAPLVTATDGELSGDVSAMAAYYGGEVFNQGAPKPGGSEPGPTGTIDADTGEYVLEWSSLISGGAFDGFTGVWHFEGTFAAG